MKYHASLVIFIACLCLLVCNAAGRRSLMQPEPKSNTMRLKEFKNGGGSMKALGREKLRRVKHAARWEGTIEDLADVLDNDGDLAVDLANEDLLYECQGVLAPEPEITSGVAPGAADPVLTRDRVFRLHSRPSATKKLLLDFDGHTTTNTAWNSNKGMASIVTKPFDKDNILYDSNGIAAFSDSELADIVAIWRAVAEDYAAFDVDVTTEDQAGTAVPYSNMMRAAIGGSWADWYGSSCGGVAYVNSFGRTDGSPAFIFVTSLYNYTKYIWEATSHELGHTLGLQHDGSVSHDTVAATTYYAGQGNWAPIMGSSYSKDVTHFDSCQYSYCNNKQDDFATIATYLPLVPQRNGADLATATPMTVVTSGSTTTATASGIISQPGQADVFSFSGLAGASCSVSVLVVAPWTTKNRANLDAVLSLRDPVGKEIANLNPAGQSYTNGLGIAPVSVTLGATSGLYYVSVTGAGQGDALVDGYTSYGSRGQFEVSVSCTGGSVNPGTSPPPSSVSPSPSPSPSPTPSNLLNATAGFLLSKSGSTTSGYTCYITVTIKSGTTTVGLATVEGSWYVPSASTSPTFAFRGTTSSTGQMRNGTALLAGVGASCKIVVSKITLPAGYTPVGAFTYDRSISW